MLFFQVHHYLLRSEVPQHYDGAEGWLYHRRDLDVLYRLWHRLHHLLRLYPRHHLPGVHVLRHAAHHGLPVQSHVHAGALPRQAHRRSTGLQLHPPTRQHEGSHHADHPPRYIHRLLGSLLPPPHPHDLLSA